MKSGTTFTGFYSLNGSFWSQVGAATTISLTANSSYLLGLAVTAHNNNLSNTATFAGTVIALSGSYADSDIGSPGNAGSASQSDSTYTVSGGGSDIWGSSDQFNYDYWVSNQTNKILIAKLTSISDTDPWAKAGIMFRDSTGADAIFVDLLATESNGVNLQWRSATGAGCLAVQVASIPTPTANKSSVAKISKGWDNL